MRRKAEASRSLKGQTQIRQCHFCCNLLAKASQKGKRNRLHLLMGRMTHACKDRKKQAIAIFKIYLPYSSTLISCEFVTVFPEWQQEKTRWFLGQTFHFPIGRPQCQKPSEKLTWMSCVSAQGPISMFYVLILGGGDGLQKEPLTFAVDPSA